MGREARRKSSGHDARETPEFRSRSKTKVVRRTVSPWGKMSDKLASVAEPWTQRLGPAPSRSTMTVVYEVTGLIWNASRLSEPADVASALTDIRHVLVRALPDLPPTAVQELLDEIFQRARDHYSDDPRLIARTAVEDRGGGNYHISVASMECK